MDVAGVSTADGAKILQYTAKSTLNQQFDVVALSDGSYSIRPAHSGKSLDVFEWNANDGAELRQWTYLVGANQRWHIDSVGGGSYSITSVFSGKVVEVWQMSTAAGADLRLNTYVGGAGQKWSFIPVSSTPSAAVNVYLAGDSIVSTYADTASPNDQAGWGQMLPAQYDSQVKVINHAVGGRTARRFIDEGRLNAIWSVARPGDYLLVQFGTNDGNRTATYTINGQTIPYYLEPSTDFKYYLSQYISGARGRNVNLVFVTPTPRNSAYSENRELSAGDLPGPHTRKLLLCARRRHGRWHSLSGEWGAHFGPLCRGWNRRGFASAEQPPQINSVPGIQINREAESRNATVGRTKDCDIHGGPVDVGLLTDVR
jgi:lysophospholipase L1-like esterase